MRDFPQVTGHMWQKQESEPKCVIRAVKDLPVRESPRKIFRDPPSSAWTGARVWKDLLWEFLRPDRGDTGRGTAYGPPASECASAALIAPVFSLNLGKKRVWVPDEQDAYVEAEVKSEATGGRVNVETKDQKVCCPFPRC